MSQSLDATLKSIIASADSTRDALVALETKLDSPDLPELVVDLMAKTGLSIPEGVSLLDLKNNAMLSYVNNLALIILSRLEATKTNNTAELTEVKNKAVQGSITQRVVMERGVKGLEKKLQYQLDKMVRNYNKMEKDSSADAVEKKMKEAEKDSDSEEDSEDEDSEAEDELNYRPDASSLVASLKKDQKDKKSKKSEDGEEEGKTEKYRPPKIAAALPPQEFREAKNRGRNTAKLQSMEEYLMETGDAPMAEASIGSTIIDHGRGGVKTARDRQKEEEIKRFEESNFTRLSTAKSKKDKQAQKRRQQDTFFGEDWGIFNNRRDDHGSSSKRSKPKSAWDRAKKRRTD
ncbi:CYFA0S09e04940g1_1 [Cyberlindnera fabianii]|uniref:CYFA0S09e04940g1_1 n=1 Tax=Cyberlindnera fabianii TaxID=36022 RepID=A0A061AY11_CYBFA|nr:U3 small nucleolar ribonucleoprotein LCP5 [Cyberlindnera fabianii]CDR42505.1 CYFA0S09e04940g1_1 [Cyberlindnera fabianii]